MADMTKCGAAQIRLYRVRWFFEHLEYNLTLSLLWVTLVRNLVVSFKPSSLMISACLKHTNEHLSEGSAHCSQGDTRSSTIVKAFNGLSVSV